MAKILLIDQSFHKFWADKAKKKKTSYSSSIVRANMA